MREPAQHFPAAGMVFDGWDVSLLVCGEADVKTAAKS